jgi:hypothetical protein
MKRLSILAAFSLFTCISLNAFSQKKDVKQVSNTSSDEPYKVGATNITLGNQALAQKVLWIWKYYDDNTLDKAADLFADDIVATFADGTIIKGKDNFLKAAKDFRSSLTSVSSTVDACVTLKSADMNGIEVVSIWGEETDTAKEGTVTKTHLNEAWFFNEEGKVVEFHQMAAKDPAQNK